MKLLHIDSSILGQHSASRALGAAVVAARQAADPGLQVTYRDLAAAPLPHLSGGSLAGAAREGDERSAVGDRTEARRRSLNATPSRAGSPGIPPSG